MGRSACAPVWFGSIRRRGGDEHGRYHHLDEVVDPDTIDQEPNACDEEVLRTFAKRYFPDGAGPTMSLVACVC